VFSFLTPHFIAPKEEFKDSLLQRVLFGQVVWHSLAHTPVLGSLLQLLWHNNWKFMLKLLESI